MKASTLALALGLAGLTQLSAATVITESFSTAGPGSTVPVDWYATHSAGTEIVSLAGTNYLRILRNSPAGGSSAVYYTGSQGEVSNGWFSDFDASVILRMGGNTPQNQTLRGFVFRTQTMDREASGSAEFWGYSAGFIGYGEDRGLYLHLNPTGVSSSTYGTQLAFIAFDQDLVVNTQYSLRISAEGKEIAVSLWTLDGSTEIASISYSDAVETGGYFGLRSANINSVSNTSFRDLVIEVHAIPEPAGLGLTAVGALSLFAVCRRYRKGAKQAA